MTFALTSASAGAELPFFDMATNSAKNHELDEGEKFRWRQNSIKLSFHVLGPSKNEILERLEYGFQKDRSALEQNTGTRIIIGTWDDVDPVSNIFVLVGNRDQLYEAAPYVAKRFRDIDPIVDELNGLYKNGRELCAHAISLGVKNDIIRAVMFVDIDARPNFCMRRNLLAAFGLFGDLPAGVESALSADLSTVKITDLDNRLLRRVYRIQKR